MSVLRFRINSQEVSLPLFGNSQDRLGRAEYTAMIGPNGSYKSEILASLAAHFGKVKPTGFIEVLNEEDFKPPRKVITLSSSPFCKFPVAQSLLSKVKRQTKGKTTSPNEFYTYLGTKSSSIYTSNLQEKLYDLLLRTAIAALQQQKLVMIQKTFDFLDLKREVLFGFRQKYDLEHVTATIKKRVAKSDYDRVVEFMRSSKFKDLIGSAMKESQGAMFQLDFRDHATASKMDVDFFVNLEILRKAGVLEILGVTVSPSVGAKASAVYDLSGVSSGKSALLLTFLGISSVAEEGSLILIDEPEIGLHPDVQVKYVKFLDELLSGFRDLRIMVATHSPHILSSLPTERSMVLSLTVDSNGRLQHKKINQNIQGWSAEDVLLDVFGVSTTRSLDVANHAMILAETIAELTPFDANIFQRSLQRIKSLELPEQDSLLLLVQEAEAYLERRNDGA